MIARVAALAAAMVLCTGAASPSRALYGRLTGEVRDAATHTPVAGAVIVAVSPHATMWTISDGNGRFTIAHLSSDAYEIAVRAAGYRPFAQTGIAVFTGMTQQLGTIALVRAPAVGRVVATVTPAIIELRPPTGGINARGTRRLGAAGKAFDDEAALLYSIPGVIPTTAGVPAVAGIPPKDVRYEYDGVPFSNPVNGKNASSGLNTGIASIQVGQ